MCDDNETNEYNNKNDKSKKGDEDMATEVLINKHILTQEDALRIINSPIKKVKPTNVKHDYMLSKKERIEQARRILESRK